jgi:hypothetical protein
MDYMPTIKFAAESVMSHKPMIEVMPLVHRMRRPLKRVALGSFKTMFEGILWSSPNRTHRTRGVAYIGIHTPDGISTVTELGPGVYRREIPALLTVRWFRAPKCFYLRTGSSDNLATAWPREWTCSFS